MRDRLGRGAARGTQRAEAIGLGGEGIGEARIVRLEEHGAACKRGAVAAVDTAAADRLGISDAQVPQQRGDQPELRRAFATLKRASRKPLKAVSALSRTR